MNVICDYQPHSIGISSFPQLFKIFWNYLDEWVGRKPCALFYKPGDHDKLNIEFKRQRNGGSSQLAHLQGSGHMDKGTETKQKLTKPEGLWEENQARS